MGGPDGRIKWRIIGTKIIFKIKANVSRYDSWEQENHFCEALSLFAVLVTFVAHLE